MKTMKIIHPASPEYVQIRNANGYTYEFMIHDGRLLCSGEDEPISDSDSSDYDDWAFSKEDSIAIIQYLYDRIIGKKKK